MDDVQPGAELRGHPHVPPVQVYRAAVLRRRAAAELEVREGSVNRERQARGLDDAHVDGFEQGVASEREDLGRGRELRDTQQGGPERQPVVGASRYTDVMVIPVSYTHLTLPTIYSV